MVPNFGRKSGTAYQIRTRGGITYATRIQTARGTTTFYTWANTPLYFRAIDAASHAVETPIGVDGCNPDPRILAIYSEAKGA